MDSNLLEPFTKLKLSLEEDEKRKKKMLDEQLPKEILQLMEVEEVDRSPLGLGIEEMGLTELTKLTAPKFGELSEKAQQEFLTKIAADIEWHRREQTTIVHLYETLFRRQLHILEGKYVLFPKAVESATRSRFKEQYKTILVELKNKIIEKGKKQYELLLEKKVNQFSADQTAILKEWYISHQNDNCNLVYPTYEEKQLLAQQTGLEGQQVHCWFNNQRARNKKRAIRRAKPAIDEKTYIVNKEIV